LRRRKAGPARKRAAALATGPGEKKGRRLHRQRGMKVREKKERGKGVLFYPRPPHSYSQIGNLSTTGGAKKPYCASTHGARRGGERTGDRGTRESGKKEELYIESDIGRGKKKKEGPLSLRGEKKKCAPRVGQEGEGISFACGAQKIKKKRGGGRLAISYGRFERGKGGQGLPLTPGARRNTIHEKRRRSFPLRRSRSRKKDFFIEGGAWVESFPRRSGEEKKKPLC